MPKLKLTKQRIDSIPYCPERQIIYRDNQLRGFGLRVSRHTKTFIAEAQVRGRTVRVTIGRADLVPIEAARRKAMELLGSMADGIDPCQVNNEKQVLLTVKAAFSNFFEAKTDLASSTQDGYQRTCDVYLSDWARLLLKDITRQMVLNQHRHITDENGATTANNVMRHFRSVYNFNAALHDDLPTNPA